jgi:hypothetical protein
VLLGNNYLTNLQNSVTHLGVTSIGGGGEDEKGGGTEDEKGGGEDADHAVSKPTRACCPPWVGW